MRRPRELRPATRETPRAINQQIILGLLRSHQEMSRAELARRLGMQRSAIGRIVADLIAQGLVCEGKARTTARGRRPTILHLDSRERCAVAVDVRVTRTFLVVTDLVGRELSAVESFPTDLDPRDFVEHLAHEVRRVLAENAGAGRCEGVGIAVPGDAGPLRGRRGAGTRARLARRRHPRAARGEPRPARWSWRTR